MSMSLYELSVGSYLQVLGGVTGFLERGRNHFIDNGVDLETIVETQFASDMNPFRYQVQAVCHHSRGAIEGLKAGVFSPPPQIPPLGYVDLQELVAEASAYLETVRPEEIDSLEGRDMTFQMGDFKRLFLAETFVLSFSLPNFYFHATTAYDILRHKGAPIGKRHFLGAMRVKG